MCGNQNILSSASCNPYLIVTYSPFASICIIATQTISMEESITDNVLWVVYPSIIYSKKQFNKFTIDYHIFQNYFQFSFYINPNITSNHNCLEKHSRNFFFFSAFRPQLVSMKDSLRETL